MNQLATPSDHLSFAPRSEGAVFQILRQLERIDLMLQQWGAQVRQLREHPILEKFTLSQEAIRARLITPDGAPYCLASFTQWENEAFSLDVGDCDLLNLLVARFGLSSFERDVLLLGLLPYFDSRYFSLFSALQGGRQKKWPSFELALNLLKSFPLEKILQEISFLPQSPLLAYQLLKISKTGEQLGEGRNQTLFLTDPGVYHYLVARHFLPESLADCAEWLSVSGHSGAAACPPSVSAAMATIFTSSTGVSPVMMLHGAVDSGRAMAITSAATALQCHTLQFDISRLPEDDKEARAIITQVLREVRIHGAVLLVRSLRTLSDKRQGLLAFFAQQLNQPGLRVVCLCEPRQAMIWLPHVQQLAIDMPVFGMTEKVELLSHALNAASVSNIDVERLCRRVHFTAQTLPRTLQEAESYRELRDPTSTLTEHDLRKAFRLRSQQNFSNLARRIEPKRTFDDLIVGDELQQQLGEILIATKHCGRALEAGFSAKVRYGTGVSALFYGDSGTGKTMAAEVIAGQLGVDVIQIDLAAVVSKYIGETEKNLSRIFDLAEADSGVLFFDEADALFGKRSAVKDAKDRNANIEVSYLLQRLESYPGLVVLATNNRSHLDDAFSRRFTFITRFAFPDAVLRERMWRKIWPEEFRIDQEVDFKQLALRAELTGANIRNIALLATWLAAEDGRGNICNHHIEQAMQRELAKIGRLTLHKGA